MESWTDRVLRYVLEHGDNLGFTGHFWRGCEPLATDVIQYHKFTKVLAEVAKGRRAADIAADLGINHNSVSTWKHMDQMPKLGHFLKAFTRLGLPPSGNVWLTLEHSHGHATPVGQFIAVPATVTKWIDVEATISQIAPLGTRMADFSRNYLFGFLLGIILGDANKHKQGHAHRHLDLVMSKRYETNQRIGDFATAAARQFGLRMRRLEDRPKPENKPFGFYEWVSQSSPLLDWIFCVCFGLADGQTTTYDTIHMDWAFEAPRDFRVGLLQGIAESDGSVSIASQTVEFWVLPDWDFMIKLLASFGLRGFRNREAVSLVKSQAIESFKIPVFSDHLKTTRYQRLQLMATTRKLDKLERLPETVRLEVIRLAKENLSIPQIIERVAREQKLLISFEAAQRWASKKPKEPNAESEKGSEEDGE